MTLPFKNVGQVLSWYLQNKICLNGARSLHLTVEKVLSYGSNRSFSSRKLELLVTIDFYVSKLSKTGRFIINCYYSENMSAGDIAKALNEIQNTKRFYPKLIDDIYWTSVKKLENCLIKAGIIEI